MTSLTIRRKLSLLLLGSAVVVVFCYGFALYLVRQRSNVPVADDKHTTETSGQRIAKLLATGDQHFKDHKIEQALLAYWSALSLDPRSVRAQLGIARGEHLAGRESLAAAEYERVLRLDAANKVALPELARIYSHEARTWPQSEVKYREYLKISPEDAEARLGLARVLAWQGKASEASGLYAKPDVSRLMTISDQRDYAFALVKLGHWSQAESLIKRLLASRPADDEMTLQLAALYARRKDWPSALLLYRSLLAKRPGNAHLNLSYGMGLLASGNYRAALEPLQKARNSMQSNGEAGLAYARALKGSGELKKAIQEYDGVVPQFHRNAGVLREYADALLEKRDYRKAATFYGAAYALGTRDTLLLIGYAGALSGDGKYRAALPYLEEAYRRTPTDRVTFELAKLMRNLGRNEQARELLRQVHSSAGAR